VRAVLAIAVRLISFGGIVIASVEERIKGFESERLAPQRDGLGHKSSLVILGFASERFELLWANRQCAVWLRKSATSLAVMSDGSLPKRAVA
jgi:hypothetical protein